jgi:hypothetical protein
VAAFVELVVVDEVGDAQIDKVMRLQVFLDAKIAVCWDILMVSEDQDAISAIMRAHCSESLPISGQIPHSG